MNCNEFQARMSEWLDRPSADRNLAEGTFANGSGFPVGPVPAHDPAAAAHLVECGACREFWEEMQLLGEAVRVWRAPVAQVDFKDRVLAELRQTQSVSLEPAISIGGLKPSVAVESGSRRWKWQRVAVAALIVVGLGAGIGLYRGLQKSGSHPEQDFSVKSPASGVQGGGVNPGSLVSINTAPTATARTSNSLIAGALIRETATALTGAAEALIPVNRAIVSAPPRRPRDESGTKGSEIVRRDDDPVPLAQQLRETLDDLWLPPEAVDFPPT